jgi:hypothetical protein
MKIYKVKFSDGYTKKTFIIAATNCGEALAMSKKAETGILLDGTIGEYYCEMWLKFTSGRKTCKRFFPYPAVQLRKTLVKNY